MSVPQPSQLEATPPADLEVRLPAALLERFTALLVANPPLPLMVEETFAGLSDLFSLDCLMLYSLEEDELRPVAGAGRGALQNVTRRLTTLPRVDDALWSALESGMGLFSDLAADAPKALEGLKLSGIGAMGLLTASGSLRGVLIVGRNADVRGWALAQQKTLIAASRIVAVCLERSLSVIPAPSAEGLALSNLSRLLDGVHSEAALRRSALMVLRPHLAGVSLTWVRLEQGVLKLLEFEGNEDLEDGLRRSALPDEEELLRAIGSDRVTCTDPVTGGNADTRFAAHGVAAWCAMPSRNGLALLALRQSRGTGWSDAEQRLLRAAGKTLNAALERLRALEELMAARARAEFLAGLSDALQTAQTAEEVCQIAMSLLGPSVSALNIMTLRLFNTVGHIRVSAMGHWGNVPEQYDNHLHPEGIPLERTKLTRQVFETKKPFYDHAYVREKDPQRSIVAIGLEPIFDSGGQVLAVFSVGRETGLGDWNLNERELLARAAATVGLALERSQVRLELEQSRQRAQLLAKLSDALQSALTAEEAAEFSMKLLAGALKALNIITLKLERRDGGMFLRSMGVWGVLPDLYDGYFRAPGVNINATTVSKRIVETGTAYYDTEYTDQGIEALHERRVSIGLEPIKDSSGQVLAIFSVGRDAAIGPWTDMERDLMTQAAVTVGLAMERTRNREELEARARALEEKTAEMEAFVFSVSHDLKSPMVSLEGMSTLLEEAVKLGDGTELDFFVSRLRANVQTMTGLVNGLLELSRVGRIDESLDTIDTGRIIQTVLGEREVMILVNHVTVDIAEDFPLITYSPERFYQLMSNLIGNAIKFLPDKHPSPRLEITWTALEHDLEFRVSDNGPGIPQYLKQKSLELFSRLNPNIEGTGVGLAMVKRILELNDGTLALEDTPGGGLTVAFTVPASRWVK